LRHSVDHETIGNYLYVFTNMPPLCAFDPRLAVLHWLSEKDRRKDKHQRRQNETGFGSVFMALKNNIRVRQWVLL